MRREPTEQAWCLSHRAEDSRKRELRARMVYIDPLRGSWWWYPFLWLSLWLDDHGWLR